MGGVTVKNWTYVSSRPSVRNQKVDAFVFLSTRNSRTEIQSGNKILLKKTPDKKGPEKENKNEEKTNL